jgi:hypothetical protein
MSVQQNDVAARIAEMLQTDGLPGVLISNRPLRAMSQDVLHHLERTKTPIYVRHGQLVRIQRKEDGTPCMETLTETAFKGMLARAMNFVKVTVKGPMHIAPPDSIVKDILALGEWPFPPLESIIEFPVFRPDGTLIETPGYDAATRLAYVPLPTLHIPSVPVEPTWEQIVDALALIDETIGEFPYQDEASHANAQIAIPQKEENLERNTSLEQVGGWFVRVIPLGKKVESEGNKSATSAYLQEHCTSKDERNPGPISSCWMWCSRPKVRAL